MINFQEDGYFEFIKNKISVMNDMHDIIHNDKTGRYYSRPMQDFKISEFLENTKRRLEQDGN